MAKYKSYINGRRKSGSDTLDEPQNGRRSVGAEELDNFAPLAHGENGAGSGQYHGDRVSQSITGRTHHHCFCFCRVGNKLV